jgi:hypothetical protein
MAVGRRSVRGSTQGTSQRRPTYWQRQNLGCADQLAKRCNLVRQGWLVVVQGRYGTVRRIGQGSKSGGGGGPPDAPDRAHWNWMALLLARRCCCGCCSLLLVCLGTGLPHFSAFALLNTNVRRLHPLPPFFPELSCFVVVVIVAVVAIPPLRPITPRLDKFTALLCRLRPSQAHLPSSRLLEPATHSFAAQSLVYCHDLRS